MVKSLVGGLPILKGYARVGGLAKHSVTTEFFDVKFYPYTAPGVDPVFAVVGSSDILICRPSNDSKSVVEVLDWHVDLEVKEKADEERKRKGASATALNSCAWAVEPRTGDPLLCVTGALSTIKVFNVKTGKLVRSLTGHGKAVNDLAVHPLDSSILASASDDYTVRFWSLRDEHKRQPTILMCAGEGHKAGLLTLAFHESGRYLLTGGMDTAICLWTIPILPNEASGTDHPTIVHYPHFHSSAIHSDYVDCLTFYHDLILSKCAEENKIILWRIEGFSSAKPVPTTAAAPTAHTFQPTRSAFGSGFSRLLEFDAPEAPKFYMRFSLFYREPYHPLLVMGSEKSKLYFWDLQALEEWDSSKPRLTDGGLERADSEDGSMPPPRRGVARRADRDVRDQSVPSETTSSSSIANPRLKATMGGTVDGRSAIGRSSKEKVQFMIEDPWKMMTSHQNVVVPNMFFCVRQIGWSVGGEWMVTVGNQGMIVVFGRKLLKEKPPVESVAEEEQAAPRNRDCKTQ